MPILSTTLKSCLRFLVATVVTGIASAGDNGGGHSSIVDDTSCDCFLTNGSTPAYYAKHMFFDFRSLSGSANIPDVVTDSSDATAAPPGSDYFASDDWTKVWSIQNWNNSKGGNDRFSNDATVLMVNSPSNIYIEKNSDRDAASETFMTMRTKRLEGFQTAAEFESQQNNYQFLSLRMLARTIGDAGAVTAMFTYRDSSDPKKVQEADIEILTRGPRNKVQYTNQPSYLDNVGEIKDSTRNASMPGNLKWTDWAVYRLDWTPARSVWLVNSEEVANISFQVPRDASGINFNSWSDGGSWSGNMTEGNDASLQIQWIEMVYNTTTAKGSGMKRSLGIEQVISSLSGPRDSLKRREGGDGECAVVCSIDETKETGRATKLSQSVASHSLGDRSYACVWALAIVVGSLAYW